MIGPRPGLVAGIRAGLAAGISADEIALGGPSMSTVTRDATSGIYCPSTLSEWQTTLSVAGLSSANTPTGLWLCQDASGNLADVFATQNLTVTGVLTYQVAASGWTRKVITIAGGTNKAIAPAGYANAATTSVAWIGYMYMTAVPGGNRNVLVLSDSVSNGARIDHIATDKLTGVDVANTATTATNITGTALFPIAYVFNRTGSTATFYTLTEAKTITFNGTITDGTKGIGAVVATADASANWGYLTAFTGAAAEQFTTANYRTLLQTLNWVPTF